MASLHSTDRVNLKLLCTVDIFNRLANAKVMKASRSVLHVEFSTPGNTALLISTLKDIQAHRFFIRNIELLRKNFIGEGKLTIQMKTPQWNLMIRDAKPENLMSFVATVEGASPTLQKSSSPVAKAPDFRFRNIPRTLPSTSTAASGAPITPIRGKRTDQEYLQMLGDSESPGSRKKVKLSEGRSDSDLDPRMLNLTEINAKNQQQREVPSSFSVREYATGSSSCRQDSFSIHEFSRKPNSTQTFSSSATKPFENHHKTTVKVNAAQARLDTFMKKFVEKNTPKNMDLTTYARLTPDARLALPKKHRRYSSDEDDERQIVSKTQCTTSRPKHTPQAGGNRKIGDSSSATKTFGNHHKTTAKVNATQARLDTFMKKYVKNNTPKNMDLTTYARLTPDARLALPKKHRRYSSDEDEEREMVSKTQYTTSRPKHTPQADGNRKTGDFEDYTGILTGGLSVNRNERSLGGTRNVSQAQAKLRESDKKEIRKNLRTNYRDLKVTKREDYPSKSGFHASVNNIALTGIQLHKIDPRMLSLTKLGTLNLSVNSIRSIEALRNLKSGLQSLTLDNNLIETISPDFFISPSMVSVNFLSLKGNQLRTLPRSIVHLKNLQTLILSENRLQVLPYNMHLLRRLIKLLLNDNLLTFLPFPMTLLGSISRVDISSNPFTLGESEEAKAAGPKRVQLDTFPTLYELTARFISTNNHQNRLFPSKLISVAPSLLPTPAVDMLESCKYCTGCGGMTPRFSLVHLQVAARNLAVETISSRTFVPAKKVVCDSCDPL